jgi:hypothetical protein
MSAIKQYKIVHFKDILQVPEEHFDELMDDITKYYFMCKPIVDIAGDDVIVDRFMFTPDGKKKSTISIEMEE